MVRSNPDLKKLVEWLHTEVTPTSVGLSGPRFNAAVFLLDGTYLPCVSFRNTDHVVDRALQRLDEASQESSKDYRSIVKSFATAGSRVSAFDIAAIERSRFAVPAQLRDQLYDAGESSMAWVSFVGRMQDGSEYSFGSSFELEFFEMPIGYSGEKLVEVFPHRELEGHRYKAIPFFECFLDKL